MESRMENHIKYVYEFADKFIVRSPNPMPFNILKIALSGHGALINCKKVLIVTDPTVNEIICINGKT